jgi:hypothetical protein
MADTADPVFIVFDPDDYWGGACPFCGSAQSCCIDCDTPTLSPHPLLHTNCCGVGVLNVHKVVAEDEDDDEDGKWVVKQWDRDDQGRIGAYLKRIALFTNVTREEPEEPLKFAATPLGNDHQGPWGPRVVMDWSKAEPPAHPYLVPTRDTETHVRCEDGTQVVVVEGERKRTRPGVPCPGLLFELNELGKEHPVLGSVWEMTGRPWDWPCDAICTVCNGSVSTEETCSADTGSVRAVAWCVRCSAVMVLDKALYDDDGDAGKVSGYWVSPNRVFVPAKFITRIGFPEDSGDDSDSDLNGVQRTWFPCMSYDASTPSVPRPHPYPHAIPEHFAM